MGEMLYTQEWRIDDWERDEDGGHDISSDEKEAAYQFVRASGGSRDWCIWWMDIATGQTRKLYDFGQNPAWSPHGGYVAFTADPLSGPDSGANTGLPWTWYSQLYMRDGDGRLHRLTSETDAHVSRPHWAPDGQSILCEDDGSLRRYVFSTGTLEKLDIVTELGDLVYSPDSTAVAYRRSSVDGVAHGGLAVVSMLNGAVLLNLAAAECPAWSPDAKALACLQDSRPEPELMACSPQMGVRYDLVVFDVESGDELYRMARGYPGAQDRIAWSPSGRQLAYGEGYVLRILDVGTGQSSTVCDLGPPSQARPLHSLRNIQWLEDELLFVHAYSWGATADARGSTICAVRTDGSGLRQLTPDATGHSRVCIASDCPSLRPDGR